MTGSGEFDAIERIRDLPGMAGALIGDDAAVLDDGLLLCADAVCEGVHFVPGAPLVDVGWKAMAANISDIAAMGGTPIAAVVTIAAPPGTAIEAVQRGIGMAGSTFGCPVVGGDLTGAATLVVTVAVLGRAPASGPVLRSGARPGDAVSVTGPLGGAAASGWEGRPPVRLAEGQRAAARGATAMIDVSDGFAADLEHVLAASGVGVELDSVPVAPGATLEQALGGGMDYELIVCGPPMDGLIRVGTVVADPKVRLLGGRPFAAAGWEHSF